MRIIHRISVFLTPPLVKELATMGIDAGEGFATFEVDENHPSWPSLRDFCRTHKAVDVIRTTFSKGEILGAEWLQLLPTWHHGYPQPDEDNFGYLEATYDLQEYCDSCGVGAKQKAPFQMKGEPKWGRNRIMQLNWVFDVFFSTPQVWEQVFAPHGVECAEVMNSAGKRLETVVQLLPAEDPVDVSVGELEEETCIKCRRTKYAPATRGTFPRIIGVPLGKMVKTAQWFGSGASGHRCVLVSNEVGRSLVSAKVSGASLRPVTQT
jgi:rRNA maturation protein Nop10